MSRLQDYDPTVIEVAARRLYEKATASLLISVVGGASLGAAFGAVPLTPLGAHWPIPSTFGPATMLVGALCGAAIGYVIGDNRAFRHRLQAQAMLTDLQREVNTAATVDALREIVARMTEQFERDRGAREAREPAQAPPAPAPAPVPVQPEPQPAPPAVLLSVSPALSPEPAPQVFAVPEPAPLSEPEAEPEPAPEPEAEPAFALPEPLPPTESFTFAEEPAEPISFPEVGETTETISFPAVDEPFTPAPESNGSEPPPATDLFPPISADAR